MQNALVNIDLEDNYKDALTDIGYKLEELYEQEVDPGLGNGVWADWRHVSWILWQLSKSSLGIWNQI